MKDDKRKAAQRARIGRALALARNRARMTQGAAADEIGVRRPTLSDWERGNRSPDVTSLEDLADLYGVTLDELCGHAPLPPAGAPRPRRSY